MPVMDEFKEEREALKHGTFKEKISYFVEYYKWHVIAIAGAVFFVVSIGWHILTQKDTAFFAAVVNAVEMPDAEEYARSFAEAAGIDPEEYEVLLDASIRIDLNVMDQITIGSSEKLTAYIAARNVDAIVTDKTIMQQYAYRNIFSDLRDVLSEEQCAEYQPYFYYIDLTVLEEPSVGQNGSDNSSAVEYPDPRNPDAMAQPMPIGIYVGENSSLREYYYYADECIVGIAGNTKRTENACRFIDFICQ